MRELDELIDKLNSDKYAAVSVLDLDTNSFLFRNKTHAEIIAEYGTAEDFFEALFAKGHKRLNLTLKRKNGSTYKADGQGFTVNFSQENQEVQTNPAQQTRTTQQMPDMFSNSFGLGTLDIMNLMVSKNDAARLHTENEVLKAETKEQKKLIEELKEERLAAKYSTDKSKGTQEMLMGAIQHLPTLISFAKGTPMPMTGLAAAVEAYSSPVKQSFAEALQDIDDTVVNVLGSINNGLNTNVEFSGELAELLKKYKLWQA